MSVAAPWFPVGSLYDVVPRTLYRTALAGRELVLWRADDGFVNVWENRCLHRGVRLSIGSNDGAELICRYHGWRYANRSAGCTYIPAHPADSPARTITNQTFPAAERYGLIWTGDDSGGPLPDIEALNAGFLPLRSLPVNAPAAVVSQQLADYRLTDADVVDVVRVGGATQITSVDEHESFSVVFFIQPVDEARSVIRPVLAGEPSDPLPHFRQHAAALGKLIRKIESTPFEAPEPTPFTLETPVMLPSAVAASGRTAPIDAVVARKWETAEGIAAIELVATGDDPLPTFQPGAHIDVHLPGDLIRQYSITNPPGETDRYRIGVKLDPNSRGGSAAIHNDLEPGDQLQISEPRNGFPLRRNVPRTILIAGGIGVTPLLAMAHALQAMRLDFELHYFVGAEDQVAFAGDIEGFGDSCTLHVGLSPAATSDRMTELLAQPDASTQVYACGPPPMLDALRSIASTSDWPNDSVHTEYFENTNEIDDSTSFTVHLARSALTLQVPGGQTILEVLRANDIAIVSSCEQGACGTCAATIIEGEPLHQDVYLNPSERAGGMTILTCVSRATTDRLVLDL